VFVPRVSLFHLIGLLLIRCDDVFVERDLKRPFLKQLNQPQTVYKDFEKGDRSLKIRETERSEVMIFSPQ
jgi:hypothetical protein